MNFNNHQDLAGKHAFLGASNFHWINWTNEEFEAHYYSQFSSQIGTLVHGLAHDCIMSKTRLNKHDKNLITISLWKGYVPLDAFDANDFIDTVSLFVNDAIGFHMQSEILLYYNEFCFGTTDAISFDEREKILRIHDLKTGSLPGHMEQLLIYAALFCLEYHKNPETFKTYLRIYQGGQVIEIMPASVEIEKYMSLIQMRATSITKILERDGK